MSDEKPREATPEEVEQWIVQEAKHLVHCLAMAEHRYGHHAARGIMLAVASASSKPCVEEEHLDARLTCSAICMHMGWHNPFPEVVPPVVIGGAEA